MLHYFNNFRVNRVVGYFIVADLILFSGWGLVSPVFSIFVVRKIATATLLHVGIGAAIYWIIKSLVQLPLGQFLDAKKEKLSFYALILGLLMTSASAFGFLYIIEVWHLYAVQFLHGLGMAFYVVAWNGVFSHHLDKNRMALEWAMNSSSLGFASGIMALVGGYVSNNFGFEYIFIAAGALSALAAVVIFLVPDLMLPHGPAESKSPLQDHTPKTLSH